MVSAMFSTLFTPVAFADHIGYCTGEPNWPYSTNQADCEDPSVNESAPGAGDGAGTWVSAHSSLAGGPITLNVVENNGNADLSWNDIDNEDGYQILKDNGVIDYAAVGATAHIDNGSTSGDYVVKGIQYDPVSTHEYNPPGTQPSREWQQATTSSSWLNWQTGEPYDPSSETSDYVFQLANLKLGVALPAGSTIHVLNPNNFYKVGVADCDSVGTCTVTVHGNDNSGGLSDTYMGAGDTPLFYLQDQQYGSGSYLESYRTTIASAPFEHGTTKTISFIEPRLYESIVSNTATLGGGGAVPEFSDYMLMLTFLIAGFAIYSKMPELQRIVGKK